MIDIADYEPRSPLARDMKAAIDQISSSRNTRQAYWLDARHWLAYCEHSGIDPAPVSASAKRDKARRSRLVEAVSAFIDGMTDAGVASTTRARRIAALSSIFERLRQKEPDLFNPFSATSGPKRERGVRERPTPPVLPAVVERLLAACAADTTCAGKRDAALLRLLWATGMRRSSAVSLTRERLLPQADGTYLAEVTAKGRRLVRVLIRGRAAEALREHLAGSEQGGAVFRRDTGKPMKGKDVWCVVRRRARDAGVTARVSPHCFRASFVTFGTASLEDRADAAGHADVSTTRLYDHHDWRGRAAFEQMPEVEDAAQKQAAAPARPA